MSQQNPFEAFQNSTGQGIPKNLVITVIVAVAVLVLGFLFTPFTTVPAGHVGVTSLFGKVDQQELPEGFHFINPLKKVDIIDCRNKQLTEMDVGIPSQDQLTTRLDITVKWRVDRTMAAEAFSETGGAETLQQVHLVPKVRSLVREAGKGVKRAEDFYQDEVQNSIQARILEGLKPMSSKGVLVEEVLMRNIELPNTIVLGVEQKKRREQAAEQQKAELDRFVTEQKQLVAKAEAEREAAEQEAMKREALADAKAYEITAEAQAQAEAIGLEGKALSTYPNIIKWRAVQLWDGQVPRVSLGEGGAIPFISLDEAIRDAGQPVLPKKN